MLRNLTRTLAPRPISKVIFLFWAAVQPLQAEVVISKIETGPQFTELKIKDNGSAREDSPLRIKNSTNALYFHFDQKRKPNDEAFRLRYKLDGFDDNWRDLVEGQSSKVSVQFNDSLRKIVGTEDFVHTGETPGWNGSIENSPFLEFSHQFMVPERTATARIVFYGPLPSERGMGLIALDNCLLQITDKEGQQSKINLNVAGGVDLEQPLGSPTGWSREGTEAGLAILRMLPPPDSRPVIAIADSSPKSSAVWATDNEYRVELSPGDEVTLSYRITHSLGLAGPGVAHYGQLKPGRYNFRVAAARSNGELTGEEASVAFDVLPPLHQRWEFWTTLSLVMIAALAWIRKLISAKTLRREKAITEREKALEIERSRIARDLHDDIGAGLTEIAMQSDLVKQEITSGTTENALQRIENVCSSAIGLTRSVDEIVWAVNPANDTLDQFTSYLSQTTEEFLDAAAIRVRFQIPHNLPPAFLPGKMRHNLYLVVREALNNLAKHASCDLVTLTIEYQHEILKILVEDNGCGFTDEKAKKSNNSHGLINMQNRMQEIGGNFRMTSGSEKGTLVELTLPVPLTPEDHARTK